MAAKIYPAKASPAERAFDEKRDVAMLHISVKTTHHVPIFEGGTSSIGEMLDATLMDMARNGDIVDGFEMEIMSDYWGAYMRQVQSDHGHDFATTAY